MGTMFWPSPNIGSAGISPCQAACVTDHNLAMPFQIVHLEKEVKNFFLQAIRQSRCNNISY